MTVSPQVLTSLNALVVRCNESCDSGIANSHGRLTVQRLLAMLAEDAAMVVSRSGSWEGSNMANVLQSHGYDV